MSNRDKEVYFAKLAEQAERYDEMVEYMKKDMMAKTKGPQMRVQVMKIRRKVGDLDEGILNPVPVEQD
jgi:hypothetical protein